MKNIFITADIHGSPYPVRNLMLKLNDKLSENKEDNVLIILGDAGLNYYLDSRDNDVKRVLGRHNVTYFCIRGNHEQRPSICMEKFPEKWHMEEFFGNQVYVENDYPYIKYALDVPAEYNINGNRTLIIPGAYSVDKFVRLSYGGGWFKEEQCTEEEFKLIDDLISTDNNFDIVFSHTCPIAFEPTDLFLPYIDQNSVDTTTERKLGEVEYKINYKLWCFGHFHNNRVYPLYEDRQVVMIFNNRAMDLHEWLEKPDKAKFI